MQGGTCGGDVREREGRGLTEKGGGGQQEVGRAEDGISVEDQIMTGGNGCDV